MIERGEAWRRALARGCLVLQNECRPLRRRSIMGIMGKFRCMMTGAKKPLPIMGNLPGWLTLVIGRFIERRPRALCACLLLGVLAVILCFSPLSHSQSNEFTVVKEEPDAPLPAEQNLV